MAIERGSNTVTTVLKLGGSVITRKGERETLADEALDRAASAIAASATDLVLVHGGGSFGHPPADAYGLSPASGTEDAAAALDIHDAMCLLNDAVVARLQDRGVAALPVHPLSAGVRGSDDTITLATAPIEVMLDRGFVPVAHGDVIVDAGRGVSIVSGDELVVEIAKSLDAERVGLCSAVPGVLDSAGDVISRIDDFDDVAETLGGADATDVTGGMAEKVRALLALGAPASVFGLDELEAFLAGDAPGTLVTG